MDKITTDPARLAELLNRTYDLTDVIDSLSTPVARTRNIPWYQGPTVFTPTEKFGRAFVNPTMYSLEHTTREAANQLAAARAEREIAKAAAMLEAPAGYFDAVKGVPERRPPVPRVPGWQRVLTKVLAPAGGLGLEALLHSPELNANEQEELANRRAAASK